MRIICPTCASHYEVEADKIAASGQLVRCARCRDVWLVRLPAAEAMASPLPPAPTVRPEPPRVSVPAAEVIDFHAARTRLRPRAGGGAGTRERATSLSAVAAGAAGLLSLLAGLYGFRGPIGDHLPPARAAYAALGLVPVETLALRDVRSTVVAEADGTVLTLEGKIENLQDRSTAVPGITVVVRSQDEVPLYTWTAAPPRPTLGKGESVDFKARLQAPPSEGRDVRVSFATAGAAATAPVRGPAGQALAQLDP